MLPAHIVGKKALGIEDNEEAKQAVLDAIQNEDDAALAPISAFWNSGFNFTEMPDDPELLPPSGPYMISDFVADQYVTLTANPEYTGDNAREHRGDHDPVHPRPARRRLRRSRTVRSTSSRRRPPPTSRPRSTRSTVPRSSPGPRARTSTSTCSSRTRKNPENIFKDPKVREAFLKTIPRQEIVDKLIVPIAGDDAQLRSSQIFVPGAEGSDESVAEQHVGELRRGRHPGCHGAARRVGRHQPRGLHPVRVEQPASRQRVRPDPGFGQLRPASTSPTAVRRSGAACSARPARTTRSSSAGSPRASA